MSTVDTEGRLWFKVKLFVKLVVTLSNIGFIGFQGETFREVLDEGITW